MIVQQTELYKHHIVHCVGYCNNHYLCKKGEKNNIYSLYFTKFSTIFQALSTDFQMRLDTVYKKGGLLELRLSLLLNTKIVVEKSGMVEYSNTYKRSA